MGTQCSHLGGQCPIEDDREHGKEINILERSHSLFYRLHASLGSRARCCTAKKRHPAPLLHSYVYVHGNVNRALIYTFRRGNSSEKHLNNSIKKPPCSYPRLTHFDGTGPLARSPAFRGNTLGTDHNDRRFFIF